jgi:hypothetical protein
MTIHTNTSVLTAHGHHVDNIEHPDLEIPVIAGNQRQGDVLILKVTTPHAGTPLGKGVTVVRAETNTANTHTLVGDGHWEPNARANREDELVQGWLTVPADGEAFLIHTEEHSALGIGEGTYEIRRQREYQGEWRRVAD